MNRKLENVKCMMRDYETGGTVEAVESKYSARMDSNLRPSQLLARI